MTTPEWPTAEKPSRVPFLVRQVELLRQSGVDVRVLAFSGRKNPFNYIKAAWNFRRAIHSFQPDIVHAQWGQGALPAMVTRRPLVVTFRGSDLFGIANNKGTYTLVGRLLQGVSRLVARRAEVVLLVSEAMRGMLPKSVRQKAVVIPTGINMTVFRPLDKTSCRKELGLSEHTKVVLFGGDPDRGDKRYGLAVEAMRLVNAKIRAELLVARNVRHEMMPRYINAADVVLLCSTHEGSPNIVKEALACNRPVVSTDVGDVRERLSKMEGCIVVNEATPAAIAEAVLSIILKGQREYAYRDSVVPLDERNINDKMLSIYKELSNR